MSRLRKIQLATFLLALALVAPGVHAATVTTYETEADFQAALAPSLIIIQENFDGFVDGTLITDQVPGVLFSSPNEGMPGFVPVQALSLSGAASDPNALGGGYLETKTVKQSIAMDFLSPVSALAFVVIAQHPFAIDVSIELTFVDGTQQALFLGDQGNSRPRQFFGATADMSFVRAVISSEEESSGFFNNYGGLDDLQFGLFDTLPPLCEGVPGELDGVLGIEGSASDDRPGDTGIDSVDLSPDSVNLNLFTDPDFMPGDPTTTFFVTATDPTFEALGTAVVTDGAGNECTLCLDFKIVPEGPLLEEDLCCDNPVFFTVSNPDPTPFGPAFCTTSAVDPSELPPGYEPFPACTVLTIESPISGITEMSMEVPGDFEPRLRMLFSRLEGGVFTLYEDVTTEVVPIFTIPDPTRIGGKKQWSTVKVTCALLSELCNGIDDDGDGEIDEGLPVGDDSVDVDEDGFPLCAAVGGLSDCNDQIASINPSGIEVCNGMDDNCDGVADEGNPDGGVDCTVSDQLGPCADGVTECMDSELFCIQTVFPTDEACDDIDNDCDGSTDEDFDVDGDGYTTCGGDCDDADAAVNPGVEEICDGIDNDCDGLLDEGFDADGDGYTTCGGDCDDADAAVNPDAEEICDGIDNDCDDLVDEGFDADGDGYTTCGGDCDDADAAVNPGVEEICDGIDNDCDDLTDEGFDADGDGYTTCGGDCDDADPAINPSAAEICDGIDNDCDGEADDGNPGGGDQCGVSDVGECQFGVTACVGGAVVCSGNVDPVDEICGDGLDNDCNGESDEAVEIAATCSISPGLMNIGSEGTSFQFSLSSAADVCDTGNPVVLDPASATQGYISRAGDIVLPDPFAQQCPDPLDGYLGEPGIVENLADRKVTGNDVNMKFNMEADGDCRTLDGSRQELLAALADVLNNTLVPVCVTSSIDGTEFTCCSDATVRNNGNR